MQNGGAAPTRLMDPIQCNAKSKMGEPPGLTHAFGHAKTAMDRLPPSGKRLRYAPPVCAYLHVQCRLLLQPQAPPILVAPPLFRRYAPLIREAHTFVPRAGPPRKRTPSWPHSAENVGYTQSSTRFATQPRPRIHSAHHRARQDPLLR